MVFGFGNRLFFFSLSLFSEDSLDGVRDGNVN